MKKIIFGFMIILGIFAITGCGNDKNIKNEAVNDKVQTNDNKESEKNIH